jgi:hypothetical protein
MMKMMKQDIQVRQSIMELQTLMMHGAQTGEIEDNTDRTTLEHFFTPLDEDYGCSTYARQLFMPEGMVLVGKIHKKPHLTFLIKGTISVVSESVGCQRLTGPMTFVSPAGVKRVFYVEEDTIITTIHLTKETKEANLDKVEGEVISPTYEAMGLEEPDLNGLNNFLENLGQRKE